jgi:hypothetical protein
MIFPLNRSFETSDDFLGRRHAGPSGPEIRTNILISALEKIDTLGLATGLLALSSWGSRDKIGANPFFSSSGITNSDYIFRAAREGTGTPMVITECPHKNTGEQHGRDWIAAGGRQGH